MARNISVMTEFMPSEIMMELNARMSATLVGRGVKSVNEKLFNGYGPVGKYRIRKSDKLIKEYCDKLDSSGMISSDMDYDDPQIDKWCEEHLVEANKQHVYRREYAGYTCSCHVFAYYNGLEPLYKDIWPDENKSCTNMICRALGLPEMYKDALSEDKELTQLDYTIEGPKTRPIVTLNMIKHAYSELPFDLVASKIGMQVEDKMPSDDKIVIDKTVGFIESGKGSAIPMPEKSVIEVAPDGSSKVMTTKERRGRTFVLRRKAANKTEEPKKETSKEDSDLIKVADTVMESMRGTKTNKEARKQKLQEVINKATEGILLPGDTVVLTVDDDNTTIDNNSSMKSKKAPVSPIFDFKKMSLDTDSREPSKTEKANVTKVFGPFLEGKEYQLNRTNAGALELVINGSTYPSYWIDPNLCAGNGYNVLGNVRTNNPYQPLDTILVHESEKDILRKVFQDRMYILSPEEVQRCMGHMFLNQRIYQVIDMSNMKSNLRRLKKEQFNKLGQKLTFIINSLTDQEMGRFRFEYFNGVDDFMIVSDIKAKSPFPGQTLMEASGCIVTVRGDNVSIKFNGSCRDEVIEDYNLI